jgi:cation diffusion facilitator CzcD-associated flavoprotein CzcO
MQGLTECSNWQWPKIPGLHSFRGKLLHSAAWDTSYDWAGKNVAVIGIGSSGVQILPKVAPGMSDLSKIGAKLKMF